LSIPQVYSLHTREVEQNVRVAFIGRRLIPCSLSATLYLHLPSATPPTDPVPLSQPLTVTPIDECFLSSNIPMSAVDSVK
jgi:hypothetical protein